MEKVTKKKELKIVAGYAPGILAEVTSLIAEKGVNIENICAYVADEKAIFYLLTDDNEKVRKTLEGRGFLIEEREVIVLGLWNRPGALSAVASQFRQKGIRLHNVYGTSTPGGERTTIVFLSEDNDAASAVFDLMVTEE
jgi:hypothetical protein